MCKYDDLDQHIYARLFFFFPFVILTLICRLVNVIHPGIVKNNNMENIGFYLKACWTLGVPSGELFVTSDLYLKKVRIASTSLTRIVLAKLALFIEARSLSRASLLCSRT